MNSVNVPKQEYYYLDYYSNTQYWNGFKTKTLQADVQRGVTTLSETAYTDGYGSTRGSLCYLLVLFKLFGKQLTGTKAQMTVDKRHNYRFRVETAEGFTLVFEGVSAGYYGEGTRGCHDILKALGFSQKQCNYPFQKETFTCSRRIH